MRYGLAVVCATMASCAIENELRYTSTLQAETAGVALSDDGFDGHAAMSGTTCVIDTSWGCPTSDADLPSDDEHVLDHYEGLTLGGSVEGIHTIAGGVWVAEEDQLVSGVRTAGLYDDGTVVLSADAEGCWVQHGDEARVSVSDAACEDDARFSVDHHDGTLFAASPAGGVVAMSRSGSATIPSAGDLASWDASLQLLYTAFSGDDTLRALDRDGAEVWSSSTRGPIASVAARGQRGQALVLIERPDGLGGMERFDGETGRRLGSSTLPNDDGDVVVSGSGGVVGIVRADEVHFFALDDLGEEQERPVDDTPPVCIDPTNRVTAD